MQLIWAFIIGGAICVIGQILIDKTKLTAARILVLLVVVGCLLGGLGWYEPLVNLAGAGATVPLPGFGYLLAEGVKKAVREQGLAGVLTGGVTAMAGGLAVVMVLGWLAALVFNPKEK
ncbi:MAG: stage V sporulation protein AE [Defluviitaleaceae bacterium]|nr:stage V sporulation protein AE [Defluviitaleaceae bacterium]